MKKFGLFLGLVALWFGGAALAATIAPVVVTNSYVNTTAEQISSSATILACKAVEVCNASQTAGENVFVNNDSTPSSTKGVKLYPRAATDGGQDCHTWATGVQKGKNEPDVIDGTTFYADAQTGVVQIILICIP